MENGNGVKKLSKEQLKSLKKIGDVHKYQKSTHLFYENQTPIVAYLIIKGEVKLMRGSSLCKTLAPGTLFGVKHLLDHSRTTVSAIVQEGSEICFLGLSTIREALDKGVGEMATLFEELLPQELTADSA